MGYRIVTQRLDDVKMQVFGDPNNPAAAATTTVANDVSTTDHHHHHCEEAATVNHSNDHEVDRHPSHYHHHQRPSRRGTKRKLEPGPESDDEDDQQEGQTEPMDTEEAGSGAQQVTLGTTYAQHRNSVFQLSVSKLRGFRESADPSLRRSVLICNTLRCIEREMVDEGVAMDPEQVAAACYPALLPDDDLTLDPPPHGAGHDMTPPPSSNPSSSHAVPTSSTHDRGLLTNLDWPSGRLPATPSSTQPEVELTCRRYPEEEERVIKVGGLVDVRSFSWSSVLNLSSQGGECHEEMWLCEEEEGGAAGGLEAEGGLATSVGVGGGPNTSPSSSSDSGISTASDEIYFFGDVDLSLYDFDQDCDHDLSPPSPSGLLPGGAAAMASRPALAPSEEELLRNYSFAPVCAAPLSGLSDEQGEVVGTEPPAPSLRGPSALQHRHSPPAQPSDDVQSLPDEQYHVMHILARPPPPE